MTVRESSFILLACLGISLGAQASETKHFEGLGTSYSSYFMLLGAPMGDLQAIKARTAQDAVVDSLHSLKSICEDEGGIIDQRTVSSDVPECSLGQGTPNSPFSTFWFCTVHSNADCIIQ
jgi:hypothetical protein